MVVSQNAYGNVDVNLMIYFKQSHKMIDELHTTLNNEKNIFGLDIYLNNPVIIHSL